VPSTRAPRRNSFLAVLAAAGIAACAVDNELTAARDSWRAEDRPPPPIQRSGVGAGSVLFSAEPSATMASCERTLAFRDGRVRDASWAGDPAFCKRFAQRQR